MTEIINCIRCGYGEAKKAAKFYAATFLGSHVDRVNNAASDYHSGKEGDELTVEFSAGDLMTADVLRRLGGSGLLEEFSNLAAFVARAEARPAFTRAFDAQRRFFISASAE